MQPLYELTSLIGREIVPRVVRIPAFSDATLSALAMPILAIVGGKDVLIDSAGTRDRLNRFSPHAEVVFLPEGRHFLPGQTERIFTFLTTSTSRSAGVQTARA